MRTSLTKSLVMVMMLTLVLSFVVSCGGLGGSSSGSTTTITWLVRTTTGPLADWEVSVVKDFEAAHPNIHVQRVTVPNTSYDQKLVTMNAGGNPADVFTHWGGNSWADFVYRGLAADLTPYVNSSHFSFDGMTPALLKQYTVNGKIYGIPFSTGGSYLFYNVDLFKKAGLKLPPTNWDDPSWTWNTVLHDAQAITVHSQSASSRQFGFSDDLWPEDANALLFNDDIFPQSSYTTGLIDHAQAQNAGVEQAVQWQQDLVYKYHIAPNPSEVSAIGTGFLSGKEGMSMTGEWGFSSYQPAKFNFAVAPLPRFQTNKDVIFTDPWMMAKASKHPQEAWTFLQWLSDPTKGEKGYIAASGSLPPWQQLTSAWAESVHKFMPSLSTEQLTEVAQGSFAHGQESINHLAIGYGQYDNIIANVLAPVFTGKKNANAGLSDLQQQLTTAIQRSGITHSLS